MTYQKATGLAGAIIAYWAKQGFKVHAYVVPELLQDGTVTQTMTVRSDMVNGLPAAHPTNRVRGS